MFTQAQDKYIESIISRDLNASAQQNAQFVSHYLDSLVQLAKITNSQVKHALNKPVKGATEQTLLVQQTDSSYRSTKDNTGIFLAANQTLNEQVKQQANELTSIWPTLSPVLTQSFSAFYYISKSGLTVVQPADIAENLPAVYDFNRDLFYKLGTPVYNPTRQPIWTPVYYDQLQDHWMSSLVIPVYLDNEFYGVTSFDFLIQDLKTILLAKMPDQLDRDAFVFDSKNNLIFHPQYESILTTEKQGNFAELNNEASLNQDIHQVIRFSLQNTNDLSVKEYNLNGEKRLVAVTAIPQLGWYFALTDAFSIDEHHLQRFRQYLLFGAFFVAVLLSLIIYCFLNRYVLSRLRHCAKVLTEHKQGQLKLGKLTESSDEVGTMARTLESMSGEIHNLIEGLNEKIHEKEIAELSALKLSNAVKHSETAIAILNNQFEIEFVNPKFVELTGRDEFELIGAHIESVVDKQMHWLLDMAYEQLNDGRAWKGELLIDHPLGEGIWVSQTFSPMTQDKQGANHFVSATQDISFIKQSQKKMEKLAYHDPLTNLYNRTFFKAQLTKSLEMTKRGHYAFSLFYFDLDHFKRVNDDLGHEAGDQLLTEIAKRLKQRLRAEDTIARLGGDEFAIIMSGISSVEKAQSMATDVQNIIAKPIKLAAAEVLVTASMGITLSPKDALSIEDLLRNADLAMYKAKNAGRNGFYFYNDELNKALQESILLESELRIALKEQEFELYYQPQIDLKTGKIFGFEALLRWNHPTRGMIPPNIFIPVAEQSGLIVALGEWVLTEASLFIARLNQKHNQSYMVAVNLSARQFKDKNVANIIQHSIARAGIKSEWLDIELTESMLMGDINEAIHQMQDIKALGVQLSIDDFGTGYSSLSYLKRFPIDTLKVDRAFIKDIPHDKDDMAISDAIIAMAHKLNMKVIAEGIEHKEHVQFLVEKHCQVGQGYLFSPPIPEKQIELFLNESQVYQHLFNH
ncbi:bifunctional diguanylate cyclase/phosphodiesterase [Catenovulum adriaticum]|uniref:EAL domain-containing protein n=1 Tax=Catenovulum adriaticum TaxID=2984846 RepID=A0ABY7AQS4_9ALTE|nr:EAL domain-containing protein [Catenovulum sp. TS8]WAJ71112.1 EAL domain-containing protein [Catenovulum sp. TS8]